MARSRSPFSVLGSGALRRLLACSFKSQFPTRLPRFSTPGTRSIAAATAGSSIWLSAISRRELADGREPEVDGRGGEPVSQKGGTVLLD